MLHSCRLFWLDTTRLCLKFSVNTIAGFVTGLNRGALLLLLLFRKSSQLVQGKTIDYVLVSFILKMLPSPDSVTEVISAETTELKSRNSCKEYAGTLEVMNLDVSCRNIPVFSLSLSLCHLGSWNFSGP